MSVHRPRHFRSPKIILLLLSALLGGALAAGCGARRAEPVVDMEASEPTTTPAGKPETPRSVSDMAEYMERMGFWIKLAVPPVDRSEGGVAFEAYGYSISETDYESALADFLGGRELTPPLEDEFRRELGEQLLLLRWIEVSGRTGDPDFRVRARREMRQLVAELALDSQLAIEPVTDGEIEQLYLERASQFQAPERVQVRIILLPTPEEAIEVLKRLDQGEPFRALAAELSRHESRSRFGELEPFARGTYIREFEDKAFAMEPGETSTVATPAGTFIIQKTATIPATVVPLADVRDELRTDLEKARARQAREDLLHRLRVRVERPSSGM